MKNNWKTLIGKQVRLIIEDTPFPRPKDGTIESVDDTHVWLDICGCITPFSRITIRRIEVKDD